MHRLQKSAGFDDRRSSNSIDFDDIQSEKNYKGLRVYCETKLMNVLFTYELARRLGGTGVTANCLHPGVVRTNIMRDMAFPLNLLIPVLKPFFASPEKGARTSLYAATAPELADTTGKYFDDLKIVPSSKFSHDQAAAIGPRDRRCRRGNRVRRLHHDGARGGWHSDEHGHRGG